MFNFQRFRKGKTAGQANLQVATSWDEFPLEDYSGGQDGDDSIHHEEMKKHIPPDKLIAHKKEKPYA